jgi:UDP-N-acetylmuramyl tripeptide synthase
MIRAVRTKANPFIVALGKAVRALARLRGGGSALPGLVVERLDKDFAVGILGALPYGVVVVSGTNGKTTTAKIVTELLEASGLRVFTNPTGSNFMRGVISALLPKISLFGRLAADIAVLELDEAHAALFVERIKPRYALLLNVMRDQLDRFGEIDYTASLLATVARNTIECVVLNANDERLAAIAAEERLNAKVEFFELAESLRAQFPTDDELYDNHMSSPRPSETRGEERSDERNAGDPPLSHSPAALVTLQSLDANTATFIIDGELHTATLALKGIYNTYNAAAALALAKVVMRTVAAPDQAGNEQLLAALAKVTSAFGRGEAININGVDVELYLVKNPGGFRLALESFDASGHDTMIAINDEYADGRDMSWLFDVNFTTLEQGVAMVSGVRAWDMALRLSYDEVAVTAIDPDLAKACDTFLAGSLKPKRIYCTYTAMLAIRAHLATKAQIERVL